MIKNVIEGCWIEVKRNWVMLVSTSITTAVAIALTVRSFENEKANWPPTIIATIIAILLAIWGYKKAEALPYAMGNVVLIVIVVTTIVYFKSPNQSESDVIGLLVGTTVVCSSLTYLFSKAKVASKDGGSVKLVAKKKRVLLSDSSYLIALFGGFTSIGFGVL